MEGRDGRAPKWFTAARKFPQLIGRTPDGTQLPGGPYTITQLVVGGIVALLLWNTTGVWARFGLAGNIIVGPAILIGVVIAVGKLPFGMRNPVVVCAGWVNALSRAFTTPRPVILRPPHRAGRRSVLMITDPRPVDPRDDRGASIEEKLAAPAPSPTPSSLPALTGVQKLLAAAKS